jgi:catechol 2,3-dioxygenase-like lactoylglutathione lyase family enzyme
MPLRNMTSFERALVDGLLSEDFPGRDALRAQLERASVETLDEHGCLQFRVEAGPPAPVELTVPVEAEAQDADGGGLHMLLFVRDGVLDGLEFFRDDGAQILKVPPPERWELFLPYRGRR